MTPAKEAKFLVYILVWEKNLSPMVLDTLLHPIPKSVKQVTTTGTQRNTSPVQEQEDPHGKFADLLNPLHLQIQLQDTEHFTVNYHKYQDFCLYGLLSQTVHI